MDESNLEDVTWCINTPRYERLAREAARKLFRSMHPFQGASVGIKKTEYERSLEKLATNMAEKKILQKAGLISRVRNARNNVTDHPRSVAHPIYNNDPVLFISYNY